MARALTGVERDPWMRRCLAAVAGEGLGVHILTGPVYIEGAEPGDIVEVRILDLRPRPGANPRSSGVRHLAATPPPGGAIITRT